MTVAIGEIGATCLGREISSCHSCRLCALLRATPGLRTSAIWVVSRSALGKQKVYYPRVSAEAEDVRYTIQGFRVLIKNDFEV